MHHEQMCWVPYSMFQWSFTPNKWPDQLHSAADCLHLSQVIYRSLCDSAPLKTRSCASRNLSTQFRKHDSSLLSSVDELLDPVVTHLGKQMDVRLCITNTMLASHLIKFPNYSPPWMAFFCFSACWNCSNSALSFGSSAMGVDSMLTLSTVATQWRWKSLRHEMAVICRLWELSFKKLEKVKSQLSSSQPKTFDTVCTVLIEITDTD